MRGGLRVQRILRYPNGSQVAKALGLGRNTVYQLVHTHQIGYKRIGTKIIIPKACLIDFVLSARYTVANP